MGRRDRGSVGAGGCDQRKFGGRQLLCTCVCVICSCHLSVITCWYLYSGGFYFIYLCRIFLETDKKKNLNFTSSSFCTRTVLRAGSAFLSCSQYHVLYNFDLLFFVLSAVSAMTASDVILRLTPNFKLCPNRGVSAAALSTFSTV